MNDTCPNAPVSSRLSLRMKAGGFTIVEVMVAVLVLGLVISACLMTLRVVFFQVETIRNNTLASQILQSEMENLRLRSWSFIKDLENGEFQMDEELASTPAHAFKRRRFVYDLHEDLRELVLEVEWTGIGGTTSTRRYATCFARDGLNDYYYRAF